MTEQALLAPAVAAAIEELEQEFGAVALEGDGNGGAVVTLEIDLGEAWSPQRAPLSFQLPFNYPFAAIYPYYLPAPLTRVDGAWPAALQPCDWRDRQVVQVSLRATRWQPEHDTACNAVAQVRNWFHTVAG